MKATLTITPETNIDAAERKVTDLSLVRKVTLDWTDKILVLDVDRNREETINVSHVSLYDHRLIEDGIHHRILHMLSLP